MDLDVPACAISVDFGNDDPAFSNPGDEAVLTVFDGATQVGQVSVVMNRNDTMDQTISISLLGSGVFFDRATLLYDVTTVGLIEMLDNIVITDAGP
jgi:hypothetical protein